MAVNVTKTHLFEGDRKNRKQGIRIIPAQNAANKPGILGLQDVDNNGVIGEHYLWVDSNDNLRIHTSIPTDQDSDGTAIGASTGASKALDDLASVAINADLDPGADGTIDLGNTTHEYKDIWIDGVGYIDSLRADIAELGDATQNDYIKVADNGVMTMEGGATIDGIGAGNLVDKAAAEVITGGWDITTADLDIKANSIKVTFGADGSADSYIEFDGTDMLFYDSNVAGTVTLSQLQAGTTLSPVVTGDLTISEGKFNWTDAVDETAATWSFANTGAGADIDITSSATSGEVVKITADSMANGSALLIDCDGGVGASGYYIEMYNGSAVEASFGNGGVFLLATTADVAHKISRNNATGTAPVLEIEETNAAGGVALLVDSDHTGAADAVQITYAGTDSALNATVANTGGAALTVSGPAAQTVSLIDVVGTTGAGWDGATGVGCVNIATDGAHAHANASNLNITAGTGAMVTAARGSLLRLVDTQTNGADSWCAYLSTTNNDGLLIGTGHVNDIALKLSNSTAGVAQALHVDGTTGSFVGAGDVGLVDIDGDGVLVAGANLLRVSSTGANVAASHVVEFECTGNVTNSTDGTALRVMDTGTVAGTSSAVYVDSTANNGMEIQTTAVAASNLILTGSASQTASMLSVDGTAGAGWDGATGVGMVNLAGDGAHIHANASLLNITDGTGAMIGSARGACLRIIDTTTAGADSWIAYMDTTNNDGLLINTGAVSDINLKLTGLQAQTSSMAVIDGGVGTGWDGADDTGCLHVNTHILENAGATALFVDHAGAPKAAAEGACARFIQSTGNATTDAFLVQIAATTTGGALHIDTGYALFDEGLTVGGGYVAPFTTVTTDATNAAVTYTAAEMLGGLIIRSGIDADRIDVTATATLIVAAIPGCVTGSSFHFYVQNADDSHKITVDAGADVTMSPGDGVIELGETGHFLAVVTNHAVETVTIYCLGVTTSIT